jgi:hypothetical protein
MAMISWINAVLPMAGSIALKQATGRVIRTVVRNEARQAAYLYQFSR